MATNSTSAQPSELCEGADCSSMAEGWISYSGVIRKENDRPLTRAMRKALAFDNNGPEGVRGGWPHFSERARAAVAQAQSPWTSLPATWPSELRPWRDPCRLDALIGPG
jgi:hypothetical protein